MIEKIDATRRKWLDLLVVGGIEEGRGDNASLEKMAERFSLMRFDTTLGPRNFRNHSKRVRIISGMVRLDSKDNDRILRVLPPTA